MELIFKGAILVDQTGTEWVAITDSDDNGEFRCANESGMATGNVNMTVRVDPS